MTVANPVTISEFVSKLIDKYLHRRFMRATVTGNDSNQVYVRRIGFTEADTSSYPKLSDVSVSASDEVLMIDITGQGNWVVIGKIIHN